ncbi:hypothetical protein [Natrinema salsiterrestre]|uniref:Antitoxin n=1 Tax=Natrinema salsiterrestre TaxID=2950540 RepID=A0A9Q4Q3D6_9EURY|nr:hypothetical protein [Natrinema salsiterrestre]MDF9747451.1 hypothetical protein [Natrinema salsiterrestre]
MAKMIRVPDEYHAWVKAHNQEGETMFETLRRLTREPDPEALAGILSSDEVDDAREAAERFGGRDEERLKRAREAFKE